MSDQHRRYGSIGKALLQMYAKDTTLMRALLTILETEHVVDSRALQAVERLRQGFEYIGLALFQPPLH